MPYDSRSQQFGDSMNPNKSCSSSLAMAASSSNGECVRVPTQG